MLKEKKSKKEKGSECGVEIKEGREEIWREKKGCRSHASSEARNLRCKSDCSRRHGLLLRSRFLSSLSFLNSISFFFSANNSQLYDDCVVVV